MTYISWSSDFLYNSKAFWHIFMKLGNINIKWDVYNRLLKLGHRDLYFMVQWFSLYNYKAFWHIFMKLGNINIKWDVYNRLLKLGHRDLYLWYSDFLYNSKAFWHIFLKLWNISIKWDVLQLLWSLWPLFHGPMIFLYNSKDFFTYIYETWDHQYKINCLHRLGPLYLCFIIQWFSSITRRNFWIYVSLKFSVLVFDDRSFSKRLQHMIHLLLGSNIVS